MKGDAHGWERISPSLAQKDTNVAQRDGVVKDDEMKVSADLVICVSQQFLQLQNFLCLLHFLLYHRPFLLPDSRFEKESAPACPEKTLWWIFDGSGPAAENYGYSD